MNEAGQNVKNNDGWVNRLARLGIVYSMKEKKGIAGPICPLSSENNTKYH